MNLEQTDPQIFNLIQQEATRQETTLELIASENHVSPAVREAAGSVLTNKYAEGYPGARYYQGCGFYDSVEQLAIDRAKQLFGCKHANVQPHSGANANLAAFMALMQPGDPFISINLASGGHLSPWGFLLACAHMPRYGAQAASSPGRRFARQVHRMTPEAKH